MKRFTKIRNAVILNIVFMAEFKVLLVEDAPETIMILKNVLELKELKWVLARNSTEATQMLYEHCPHLLIVDISLGPEDNGLTWLKKVKQGPFAHIHALVMTSSAFREDVQSSISMGVNDYILKPADYMMLTKKIAAIRQRLRENPPYEFKAPAEKPLQGKMKLKTRIQAISETGLCLSSAIPTFSPMTVTNYETGLFTAIEVPAPLRITMMNFERSMRAKPGFLYRNYCQIQGWQERDLQKVRRWIRAQKLGRSF
jgi:CheY-like chemotaxis protein